MGVIESVKSWLGNNFSREARFLSRGELDFFTLNFARYGYSERNFKEFVNNGYGRNPYVFMVVDRLSNLIKDLPLKVVDSDGQRVEDSDLSDLMKAPNSQLSWKEFIYMLSSSYITLGNAIVYGRKPIGFSEFAELDIVLAQDVTITTTSGDERGIALQYLIENIGVAIDAENILHIKRPNIIKKSVWGLSPLYSGQPIYSSSNNVFTAGASIHNNRGASGILSPDSSDDLLTPSEQTAMQSSWDLASSGADKTGKVHVSTVKMSWTPIGMTATDLKLIEFNIQHLRDTCSLLGVDSAIFNDPTNSTYNNRSEAQKAIYNDTVLPLANDFYSQLSEFIIGDRIDAVVCVDESKVKALQEGANEKHKRINEDVRAGIITPEEARNILYPEL